MYNDKRKFLKYGRVNPLDGSPKAKMTLTASQVLKAASGLFMYLTSGALSLCDDTTQTITGWAETYEHTTVSGEECVCDLDLSGIFRLPIGGSTSYSIATYLGALADLDIASYIQGVDLAASTHDLVRIVDGDLENQAWVDVMINPEELG